MFRLNVSVMEGKSNLDFWANLESYPKQKKLIQSKN